VLAESLPPLSVNTGSAGLAVQQRHDGADRTRRTPAQHRSNTNVELRCLLRLAQQEEVEPQPITVLFWRMEKRRRSYFPPDEKIEVERTIGVER
jgi:hypothetical protein